MTGYLILTACVLLSYLILIDKFTGIWKSTPDFDTHPVSKLPSVTVLVVARNEEEHIEACLRSILAQDYPAEKFTLLLVDNHSVDKTVPKAHSLASAQIRILALSDYMPEEGIYKKEAIAFGVSHIESDWILVTDADCVVPSTWVNEMISFALTKKVPMVLGPLAMNEGGSMLETYQMLDLAGLMVCTFAGLDTGWLVSANGANMAFKKAIYSENFNHRADWSLASGDDVFFVQSQFMRNPESVLYLKSRKALVFTLPERTWHAFFYQRKRWAAKGMQFLHTPTRITGALVFVNALFIFLHLLLILVWGLPMLVVMLIHLVVKSRADFQLIRAGQLFVDYHVSARHWMTAFLINPLAVTVVGLSSLLDSRYVWKGRQTR